MGRLRFQFVSRETISNHASSRQICELAPASFTSEPLQVYLPGDFPWCSTSYIPIHKPWRPISFSLAGALVFGFFAMRQELARRKLAANPYTILAIAGLAGAIGAQLFGPLGFAYDGAFLVGIAAMALLARRYRIPVLMLLDATCSAAALGYGIFRVGDLFRTNQEYVSAARVLHLQLRPVHELVAAVIIFWILWRLGSESLRRPMPNGQVFATYLMCFGGARFLIVYFNAQTRAVKFDTSLIASSLCVVAGAALFATVKARFHKIDRHHRILLHKEQHGDVMQQESHYPTPECPYPERWRKFDAMTAEVEVLEFLRSVVTTIKPNLVVETGTFLGISTLWIAEGLKQNGFGRVITCEFDPKIHEAAQKRFDESGLAPWIEARLGSSLDLKWTSRSICYSATAIFPSAKRKFAVFFRRSIRMA